MLVVIVIVVDGVGGMAVDVGVVEQGRSNRCIEEEGRGNRSGRVVRGGNSRHGGCGCGILARYMCCRVDDDAG